MSEVSDPTAVVEDAPSAPVTPPVYSTPSPDATIYIDGVDVTNCAISGSSTHRLNRPAQAQVRLPMDCAIGGVGSKLKIYFGATLHHHGRILLCETEAGEDTGYAVYNSMDPMEMWQWRPVRDDDCDFSNPLIISDYVTGPQIIEAMLLNSEGQGGCSHGDCEDVDAEFCEGDLFLEYGSFEGGGCDLTGAPTDWPMTMAELSSLLISTGCVDIVLTPIDSGGNMAQIDGYNGDYGTDLSGSVVFEYGTGAHNIRRLRWNQDMSNVTNKLWYFAGPRIATPADPGALQHWCFNVQGDDPGLPDPIPNGQTLATLLADRQTSRSSVGTRMEIQIFDASECNPNASAEDCCAETFVSSTFRELYRNRWATESWIRTQPRELIHITPTRDTGILSFGIGDLIGVEAVSAVRGGFSGAQRVYSYTISWDEDGVLALSELQTSPTAD